MFASDVRVFPGHLVVADLPRVVFQLRPRRQASEVSDVTSGVVAMKMIGPRLGMCRSLPCDVDLFFLRIGPFCASVFCLRDL